MSAGEIVDALTPAAGLALFVLVLANQAGFLAHRSWVLLGGRFLPELNPVAALLAGATRVRSASFLMSASGSALVWAGAWAGAGYLLREAIVR